jgi:hypothetical protein
MPSPDRPQFIEDPSGITFGHLKFKDRQPGVNHYAQPQPGRERTVIRTPEPEFDLVEVHFWRHSAHSHPRADLRDLILPFDSPSREELAERLRGLGFKALPEPKKEQNEPNLESTETEETQDFVTDPYKHLFTTKAGVRVPKEHRRPRR